jgi:hypothetical protein
MKRLQILIDEELDVDLERRAKIEHTSKAALIRQMLRTRMRPTPSIEDDPLWGLVGAGKSESANVDDVVYPR